MVKRLATVLLSAGLLLSLTPATATAASRPYHHGDDDHYRCMYHCESRYRHGSYRDDGWYGYDRCRWRDRWGRYRYDRCRYDRIYHGGDCWYHDRYGWHRCRSSSRYGGYGDRYDGYGYGSAPDDSAHAAGGYDSHRRHSGG
jgi:hypothetical protein